MILKIYGMFWLASFLTAALLYAAGVSALTVGVAYGFMAFGMIFMGMIAVLPLLASHPSPVRSTSKPAKTVKSPEPSPLGNPGHAVHA